MKRKMMAFVAAVALLFTVNAMLVPANAISGPTISVEKINASPGDEVSVAVTVENNPGIWGMDLRITYDDFNEC